MDKVMLYYYSLTPNSSIEELKTGNLDYLIQVCDTFYLESIVTEHKQSRLNGINLEYELCEASLTNTLGKSLRVMAERSKHIMLYAQLVKGTGRAVYLEHALLPEKHYHDFMVKEPISQEFGGKIFSQFMDKPYQESYLWFDRFVNERIKWEYSRTKENASWFEKLPGKKLVLVPNLYSLLLDLPEMQSMDQKVEVYREKINPPMSYFQYLMENYGPRGGCTEEDYHSILGYYISRLAIEEEFGELEDKEKSELKLELYHNLDKNVLMKLSDITRKRRRKNPTLSREQCITDFMKKNELIPKLSSV
jgi:hypothetical protein